MHPECISTLGVLRHSLQHYRLFSLLSVYCIVFCSSWLLQGHVMTSWTVTAGCEIAKWASGITDAKMTRGSEEHLGLKNFSG